MKAIYFTTVTWVWNKKYSQTIWKFNIISPQKKKYYLPPPIKRKGGTFSNHHLFFKEANYWPSARFFVFPRCLCHASSSWRVWKKNPPCFKGLWFFLGHPKQRYQKCMIFCTAKLIKHIYLYIEYIMYRKGQEKIIDFQVLQRCSKKMKEIPKKGK